MISGSSNTSLNLDPINGQIWTRGPRTYGFYYTKNASTNLRKYMGTFLKRFFTYLDFKNKCQVWKRRAPKDDEAPSSKIFKVMDMRPIAT